MCLSFKHPDRAEPGRHRAQPAVARAAANGSVADPVGHRAAVDADRWRLGRRKDSSRSSTGPAAGAAAVGLGLERRPQTAHSRSGTGGPVGRDAVDHRTAGAHHEPSASMYMMTSGSAGGEPRRRAVPVAQPQAQCVGRDQQIPLQAGPADARWSHEWLSRRSAVSVRSVAAISSVVRTPPRQAGAALPAAAREPAVRPSATIVLPSENTTS